MTLQSEIKLEKKSQFKSRGAALLFGLSLVFLGLGLAECVVRLMRIEEIPFEFEYDSPYFFTDAHGIIKPLPNGHYHSSSRRKKDGTFIYDVFYSTDQFSRRVTPVRSPEGRSKHLIFFGCSFTYGEGVQDYETLPAQTALRLSDYMPYNYGFHGHSPAHLLRKMQSQTLPDEVSEKEGYLIYVFLDFHLQRVIGSMRVVTRFGKYHPYYDLNARDQVVDKGNFAQGRPFLRWVYEQIKKIKLLRLLNIDFPPVITDRDIHLTARLIEESRDLYKRQFPRGNFYVVIFPSSRYGGRLIKEFKGKDIKILDYSKLFNQKAPKYILSDEDRHPNALADKIVARRLAYDLRVK